MDKRSRFIPAFAALAFGAVLFGCGCGDSGASSGSTGTTTSGTPAPEGAKVAGDIKIDGSTTVYPISEILAEDFKEANPETNATVGKVGTGSGIKKFIAGEIDIAGASRPIKADEDSKLKAAGLDYLEIPIAYDGVSVVVNPQNNWVTDFKVAELQKAFAPDSTVTTWKDINPAWPADKINFYGPSENHGTYEYFTEEIVGKKNEIRKDYQSNQEYTAVIQGISGDKNGIGYVGFNYYDENKDKVKAATIEGVSVSPETIENGTYKPLSRPLFLYVSKKSYAEKPQVKAFVDYILSDAGAAAVTEAKYVKLPADAVAAVKKRVEAGTVGSAFMSAPAGSKITDVLK